MLHNAQQPVWQEGKAQFHVHKMIQDVVDAHVNASSMISSSVPQYVQRNDKSLVQSGRMNLGVMNACAATS